MEIYFKSNAGLHNYVRIGYVEFCDNLKHAPLMANVEPNF